MNIYYETKVKYTGVDESGAEKKITETFLIDAASFGDAEEQSYRICDEEKLESFAIASIRYARFSDVIPDNGEEPWFSSRIVLTTYDERTGKEKKTRTTVLVQSSDISSVTSRLDKSLGRSILDYNVDRIVGTDITRVIVPERKGEK
jgi:hypothetical protein